MKLKGAKAVHYDSGPNMTPLVDVVMVILIFLMLAGSFGGATHYLMSKASIKTKGAGGAKLPPDTVPDVDLDLQVANNENGARLCFAPLNNAL
jgi:biopolymer transport protein ExbD